MRMSVVKLLKEAWSCWRDDGGNEELLWSKMKDRRFGKLGARSNRMERSFSVSDISLFSDLNSRMEVEYPFSHWISSAFPSNLPRKPTRFVPFEIERSFG